MKIFTSYARSNEDVARDLVEHLESLDIEVWFDRELHGGQTWWKEILSRIRGCDVFLYCLSEASIRSQACATELKYAQQLRKPVIPVQVGDVGDLQGTPVSDLQVVQYHDRGVETRVALLSSALKQFENVRSKLPSPRPPEPPIPHEYLRRLSEKVYSESISPPDQAALVGQLRLALKQEQDDSIRPWALMLVDTLSRREDTTQYIAEECRALLGQPHPASPSSSQREPPPTSRPGPFAHPPAAPGAPSASYHRRSMVLGALVSVAAVAVIAVIAAVAWYELGSTSGDARDSGARSSQSAAAVAPPPTSIAPSVPIPTLGTPIAAGQTPGFAAVSPNGRLIYITNRSARTVTVVDTSINLATATIPIDVGPPQFLSFSPDGRQVYISVFDDARTIHAVAVLDTTTNDVTATIPVRTRPFLAAVAPDGRQLWVPNHDSGTVSVIDTATNAVIREIPVPPNPHWVEFSRDGRWAYAADHESNLVSVLDTGTYRDVVQIPVEQSPHSVAVHPSAPLLANVNYDSDSVTMIDTNTDAVVSRVPVGRNPQDVAWAPDGRFAYVTNNTGNSLSVINAATMQVTATLPTPPGPTSVAVTPDGKTAYVTCSDAGLLAVLHLAG